ncbi:MAG: SpoIIE family protein phosphatase [Oscillospiraceae bacterium]
MKRLRKKEPSSALPSLRFCLLRFLMGAILSANQLFGGYAPFALGFVSAMGAGSGGLAALAGVFAGGALFMDFSRALRLAAVGILLFSANSTFAGTRPARQPLFRPVLASLLMGAVEAIYLVTGEAGLVESAEGVTAVVLCGLAAYYFPAEAELRAPDTPKERLSSAVLLAALLMSLTEVTLVRGVSLGRVLLGAFAMYIAFQTPPATAAAAGLGLGLAVDLRMGGGSLFFAAAYALASLFLSSRRESGRLIAAILYGLVVSFFLLPASVSLRLPLVEETLCAALLFLLLPLPRRGGKYLSPQDGEPSPSQRLRRQLEQTALAFRELADSFPRAAAAEENPSVLFDRVAEQVCQGCGLCDVCWKKEYQATYSAFNDATAALLRRGRAEPGDFPGYFSSRCPRFADFLDALNRELSAFLLRRQYRLRLRQAHSSARGQYVQLSDLLSRTAEELTARAVGASRKAPLAYQVGSSLRPRRDQQVSGDSVAWFESDSGRMLYLLLSDGMGSGREAQQESATAVRLLERFLRADMPAEAALSTLSSAYFLRGEEGGGFTTIDLLALDLQTAEAVLYKYGAAPSYLRQDGQVRRITGGSLPAGLEKEGQTPDATRLHLGRGAVLLLMSDGLSEREDDRWITELLQAWDGHSPQSLTALLLADSLQHGGENDDCAALALLLGGGDTEV